MKKYTPSHISGVQSHGMTDQPSIDYDIMMTKLTEILENYEESLERMKGKFMHMVVYREHDEYTDIVQSEEYRTLDSVETFFELLAPYLKTPDCSLLKALVHATNCERAIQRLEKYLDKTSSLVLGTTTMCSDKPLREVIPESKHAATESSADSSAVSMGTKVMSCFFIKGIVIFSHAV